MDHDANIKCHSKSPVTWKKNDKRVRSGDNLRMERNVLYFINIRENQRGTYTCVGSGANDEIFINSSKISVGCKYPLNHTL